MSKIHEPTLFLRDGKEWIKGYTMERPDHSMFYTGVENKEYKRLMKKFLASAVEYPVCEGSRKEFRKECVMRWDRTLGKSLDDDLQTGIRIDELADRLEVVPGLQYCLSDQCYLAKKCTSVNPYGKGCGAGSEYFIHLRPKVKEESQGELWNEIIGLMDVSVSIRILRLLKQQFTIKRNKWTDSTH